MAAFLNQLAVYKNPLICSIYLTLSFVFLVSLDLVASEKQLSLSEIKQLIIQSSIASYPGRCACPYHAASNGSRCGGRSAYSKSGGYSVICYESDITEDMLKKYK